MFLPLTLCAVPSPAPQAPDEAEGGEPGRLRRIAQGDESALSDLYDAYGPFLYGIALRMLRSVHDAEEVVQEVFLQIWKSAAAYDAGTAGPVYAWLVTMTRNRAIDRLRSKESKARMQQVDLQTLSLAAAAVEPRSSGSGPHLPAGGAEAALPAAARQETVSRALSKLSADHQRLLALAYFEGFRQQEIARKLNIAPAAVKPRLREALHAVRALVPPEKP